MENNEKILFKIELIKETPEFPRYLLLTSGIIIIFIGLIIAFYGKRLFPYLRFFIGFICGFTMSNAVITFLQLEDTLWTFISLLFGFIFAISSIFSYHLSVGLSGANIGLILAQLLLKELKERDWNFALTLLTCLFFFILAVIYNKDLIIGSAISGSLIIFHGIVKIVQGSMNNSKTFVKSSGVISIWCLVAAAILAYFAAKFQFYYDVPNKDKKKETI